jgi:excisionase family DNA binding protein
MQNHPIRVIDLNVQELEQIIERKIQKILSLVKQSTVPKENSERFINVSEASKIVHLSISAIYGKTSDKTIPFIKKGKRVLFERKKLEDWLLENQNETIAETEEKMNNSILGRNR